MSSAVYKDQLKNEFFRQATQYYIAGRFAALAGLLPVCGNLFHHAIEMYLKGCLSELPEEQRRKLGHKLPDIWQWFKAKFVDPALNSFDSVLVRLGEFEDIRYPEPIVSRGMEATFVLEKADLSAGSMGTTAGVPQYVIALEEIDELVKVILVKSSANPVVIIQGLNALAREYLKKENKHPWTSAP